jgi:hypothetical protein
MATAATPAIGIARTHVALCGAALRAVSNACARNLNHGNGAGPAVVRKPARPNQAVSSSAIPSVTPS